MEARKGKNSTMMKREARKKEGGMARLSEGVKITGKWLPAKRLSKSSRYTSKLKLLVRQHQTGAAAASKMGK